MKVSKKKMEDGNMIRKKLTLVNNQIKPAKVQTNFKPVKRSNSICQKLKD